MTGRARLAVAGALVAAVTVTSVALWPDAAPSPARSDATSGPVDEHLDDHAPMTRAGAVNTTLAAVTFSKVDTSAVAAAVPAELSRFAVVDSPAGDSGWRAVTVVLSPQAPSGAAARVAAAVRAAHPSAHASVGQVTWGSVAMTAPLTAGAPYVAAIGADTTALGSPRTIAELTRLVPGGWHLAVESGTGRLRLVVQTRTTLEDPLLDRLVSLTATEAGAPPGSVVVTGGVTLSGNGD